MKVTVRSGSLFGGFVDNLLAKGRLHRSTQVEKLVFHEDHNIAVHDIHPQEILASMNVSDLKKLARWVA